eukprot:jgi/Ulvmu1/8915/UM005_0006.1
MTQQPGAPAACTDYEGLREQYATQKEAELAAEEGDVVMVQLTMPDEESITTEVKAGHQVAYLKAWLHENRGFEVDSIRLMYKGKEMIDPLSLMDYPEILTTRSCQVTVQQK